MILATHSSGVDANLRRGVEQEQAFPSIQTLLESSQDCQNHDHLMIKRLLLSCNGTIISVFAPTMTNRGRHVTLSSSSATSQKPKT